MISIMLLKQASRVEQGAELAGRAIRGVVRGSGSVGRGLAKGVGVNEAVGDLAGKGALAAGTVLGGKKVKQKTDEWRYRHGFM